MIESVDSYVLVVNHKRDTTECTFTKLSSAELPQYLDDWSKVVLDLVLGPMIA